MTKVPAVLAALVLSVAGCSKPAETPRGAAQDAPMAMKESPNASAPAEGREDADFGLRLALLEGHLMVGRELIEAGQTQNALPHFGHPVRELYGDLAPVIEARHGAQFRNDLVLLETTAGLQPNTETFRTRFAAAMAKTHAARGLIPEAVASSDAYTLQLVSDIATTASQEYRNALIAGKIGSLVEYHDARGFMAYTTALLKDHAASADPKMKDAIATVARLMAMVAPLDAPNPPLATDTQFEAEAAHLRDLVKAH